MKLDAHKLGLVGAATCSILFTFAAVLMHLWPVKMIEMSSALFMLNSFGPLAPMFEISAPIFVSGLVQHAVRAYVFFYLFGYLFNRIYTKR